MVKVEGTVTLTAHEVAVTLNRSYKTVVRVLTDLVDEHAIVKTTKFVNNRELTGYRVPPNLLPIKKKFQLLDARKPSTLKSLHKIQEELSNLGRNKKQSIIELLSDIQKEVSKRREEKRSVFDLRVNIGEHELEFSIKAKKKEPLESVNIADEFPDEIEY